MSGKDKSAIHRSLRGAVFRIAVTEGGEDAFRAIQNEYRNTTAIDGKEICLQCMGRVQSPELAKAFMDFIFSHEVATQDKHSGAIALSNNAKVRLELWKYVRDNWDGVIFPTLSGNMVVLERFLRMGLNKFASLEIADEIAKFFDNKDQRGFDKALGVISDTVRGHAMYKMRDEAVVREWLTAAGYLEK